jgi:catechol 2,3-dioxygenase-like lactoylglutathione lyase family enzyme
MLADHAPMPTIAVRDLARAREFYETVLGFAPQGDDALSGVLYAGGGRTFLVYPSAAAGTNRATYMSFQVPADAFDAEVAALRTEGITFLTFEMEGITWDDGVGTWEGSKAVWFTDPDGNILAIETA